MPFFLFLKKNQQNTILVQSWLKSNCFRFLHSAWSTHNDFRVCQNVLITMHTYFMVIVLMDIYIYDSNFPKMSESRKRKYSLSSRTTLVPPYSGRSTSSPGFTLGGMMFPCWSLAPFPVATTVACRIFPWDFSGSMIPPFVFSSGANRSTNTRSKRGKKRLIAG